MSKIITVIVCTHNRAEILTECLEAISPLKQDKEPEAYEVLVVDNHSSDHTHEVVVSYCQQYSNYSYILEEKIGLSNARNTGYKNSQSEWVAYLDDDALASENFVSRCLYTIENHDFGIFGGTYNPWYKGAKPKWLSDEFGKKEFVRAGIGEAPSDSVSGGIMAIKRKLLEEVGGFSSSFGMKGKKIAYGEDNYIAEKIAQIGGRVGHDPEWKIDHLVAEYKHNPVWHIKRSYVHGRDRLRLSGNGDVKISNPFLVLLRSVYHLIHDMTNSLWKLIRYKNYYWQNALVDSMTDTVRIIGEYFGLQQSKKKI